MNHAAVTKFVFGKLITYSWETILEHTQHAEMWKSHPRPLLRSALFLFAVCFCAPSVSICYPSTWQWAAELYDRAAELRVERSETLPLWHSRRREPVTAWSVLSASDDRVTHRSGSCSEAYMYGVTQMTRERGQKVKKWDIACIRGVAARRQRLRFPSSHISRGIAVELIPAHDSILPVLW